jgi:hypothetical protein
MPGSCSAFKFVVFFAEPRALCNEHNEPADDGARGIGEAGHLVGDQMHPCRHFGVYLLVVLSVDGQRILAGNTQKPLNDDIGALAAEANITDDR